MPATRDPVSLHFDPGAARLLARAHAARGQWVSTRLVDPTPREIRRWQMSQAIDVTRRDNPSVTGGRGLNCRTRWVRAFVRALFYQQRDGAGALRVDIGQHMPASSAYDAENPERGGFPPGYMVRVRIDRGGQRALAAVRRLPDSHRIWTDKGDPASRFSVPDLRDWQ